MKIKPTKDLRPIEKELLDKSEKLAVSMCNHFYHETNRWMKSILKRENGLDQYLLPTYFGCAISIVAADMMRNLKKQMDMTEDGEYSMRTLWDEIKNITEFRMGLINPKELNKEYKINPITGMKTVSMKTKENLDE